MFHGIHLAPEGTILEPSVWKQINFLQYSYNMEPKALEQTMRTVPLHKLESLSSTPLPWRCEETALLASISAA